MYYDGMCADIGHAELRKSERQSSSALYLATLSLAGLLACGGHSSSAWDAGVAAGTGGAVESVPSGGFPSTDTGGTITDANRASDLSALAIDCSYLPCLASAVSTVTGCQPSRTCTYQTMTWGAVVHCFDNGITTMTDVPGSGTSVMGVKKDGNPCYAVESDSSPALPNSATVEYRDANNDLMVTVYTSDTGTAAECPGTDVAFTVPTGSTCMTAITALGGLTPESSCLNASEGDCYY
jgi:hypothetical protein